MNIRKHDRFWFDDGNVALVAHDGLAFRLHRGVLSLHSDVFQSLFAFPSRIEDNEMLENCPVVHLQDRGEDLAIFFALLYDGGKSPFFRRETHIDFHVVRAMTILSFKYDVQHVRDEALHRLRWWFPSNLAGWDSLRDSFAREGAILPISGADSIAVINMARKFNLPDLLPIAFFSCSCMPLDELLKGAYYGSDIEALSLEDLGRALAGVDKLDELIQPRLGIFVNFLPSEDCLQSPVCKKVMRRVLRWLNADSLIFTRKWTIDSVEQEVDEALERLSADNQSPDLCISCRQMLFEKLHRQREKAWNRLGGIYGVEPWPITGYEDE